MNSTTPHPRRRTRTLIAIAAAAGLLLVGSAPALAASDPAPAVMADAGWVRVAHLSPDTKAVDVKLTALSGGASILELTNVKYGAVSEYRKVPIGTYIVSMVPTGSASTAKPMVSASVSIVKDKSITVAAFGQNKMIQARVFQDDLTGPDAGAARIRLIQASTVTREVDVQTTTGILIAQRAKAGDATSYASVPAGAWMLALSASGIMDTVNLQLAVGSVNTLFVLDNANGGLTVMSVLDSASVGAAPVGGVQTGGGALSSPFTSITSEAGR